jgi:hypothetical protein
MSDSRILQLLEEINNILRKHNVRRWLGILPAITDNLRQAEESGNSHQILEIMDEILSLYGGMGSFTDLFINDQAGHDTAPKDISKVNSRLQALQEALFLEAKRISDEFRASKREQNSMCS